MVLSTTLYFLWSSMKRLRKEYIVEYMYKKKTIFGWKTKIATISYKQASMKELYEFLNAIDWDKDAVYDWIYDFLVKNSNIKWNDIKYLLMDIDNLFKIVKDTYFHGVFEEKNEKTSKKPDYVPEQSIIVFLSEKFCMDPDSLIEKYTPEMITYYSEGILWNINEQTKEGKAKNKAKANRKRIEDMNQSEKDRLDAIFNKIW